ncbi:MAG: putative stress-responsive transcriptional regulator [Bacteroidetes bacterium HLUCCA01]|nr:MAG: putative stress-responsive transcriptional regulator [Bacteroidetes bacterium HLUCCA01]
MADYHTKSKSGLQSDDIFNVNEADLESTLQRYLEAEKPSGGTPGLFNLITISGLAFLIVGFVAVLQSIIPLGLQTDALLTYLPLVGGVMVLLIGMGYFSGDRKSSRKKKSRNNTSRNVEQQSNEKESKLEEFALLQRKRLTRSATDSRLLGVCGGIARYLGLDSTLVRIAFIASLFFAYGSPVLLYFALGVILPKETKPAAL